MGKLFSYRIVERKNNFICEPSGLGGASGVDCSSLTFSSVFSAVLSTFASPSFVVQKFELYESKYACDLRISEEQRDVNNLLLWGLLRTTLLLINERDGQDRI